MNWIFTPFLEIRSKYTQTLQEIEPQDFNEKTLPAKLIPAGKLNWEGDILLLATPLSEEITSHIRAVVLFYCQSCAWLLEKRSCKPIL